MICTRRWQNAGFEGATTFCIAAATYGLIAGGLMGGPVGDILIKRKHLAQETSLKQETLPVGENERGETAKSSENSDNSENTGNKKDTDHRGNKENIKNKENTGNKDNIGNTDNKGNIDNQEEHKSGPGQYATAATVLIAAVGIGTVVSRGLSRLGLKFPDYVGAMIVATVIRNVSEHTGKHQVPVEEISTMSTTFLNLFLGIAMITLKLWQLASLALPLIILLAVQTVFMFFFARFFVFQILGHDYDAAVMTAGFCGLGLGASPTAMANMQAVCRQYRYSVKAFLIVPIVGGVILDFMNSLLITFFINIVA